MYMVRLRSTVLLAALAIAAVANAQPSAAPPPMPEAPPPPAAAEAPADAAKEAPTPAAPARPSGLSELLSTRIEQVKRGNRVSEVRVTNNSGEVRYTMENRDGSPEGSIHNSNSGLSTPNFIRIEF